MTDREKAIVMAYTGFTMLAGDKLGLYYEYVQEKLGHSVMTHEFAYPEVQDAVKEAAREDFIALAKAPTVDAIPVEWIEDRLAKMLKGKACGFVECATIQALLVSWENHKIHLQAKIEQEGR